jgi:GT2 family glycosyltransferase/SAM-dependent methyltransferase
LTEQRRASAPRLIEWTGERCVPWAPDVQVVYEHFHRYMWAAEIIAGRRVLDVGSGEGFGSAILADHCTEVVGIDIDARTVDHSQLNYARPGLSFGIGTATDLSRFESGSFGAVVAFELIEHVSEQEEVLAEIARVLAQDGLLVMSTPDRRSYSEATGQNNPFHVRELSLEELTALLGGQFRHHAVWGQRTITGSHIDLLSGPRADEEGGARRDASSMRSVDFYLERGGDDWRVAPGPSPMYLLAVASNARLGEIVSLSTLADPGVALLREAERRAAESSAQLVRQLVERDAEQARRDLSAQVRDLNAQVEHLRTAGADMHSRLQSKEAEADGLRSELVRFEGSVTVRLVRRLSGRFYSAVGEQSLMAQVMHGSLRLVGRLALGSGPAAAAAGASARAGSAALVALPEIEQPVASLVIPVHSRADLTLACLESIALFSAPIPYEVILIDDRADQENRRLLSRIAGARVIRNRRNIGYLRSVNRAAATARGRWLVLCNNDIEVRPGWLEALIRCGESAPDVGVVTPKYLFPDGRLAEAGAIVWQDGSGWNYGRGEVADQPAYDFRREVDYGSAAALLVRADLWRERGGFDERFGPMYYEDVDLCLDARERGLRVLYEPEAVVVHHEGATAGTDVAEGPKRYQEENRPKLVEKWRNRLDSEHQRSNPDQARRAADRRRGPHALIIDARVPMPDHDAGSLRMVHMIDALLATGCRVTFVPDNFAPLQPYTRDLQRKGVNVFYDPWKWLAELATIGAELTLGILSRPHQASRWLDAVREQAPTARVVYDTVDLHWLREARRAATPHDDGSLELGLKASALRELELAMIRATDATLVVSNTERAQVEADVPGATVRVVPTVHPVRSHVPAVDERGGVLFVGGFEHTPNRDAAIRLVRDVMPLVWREDRDVPVTIVGSNAPADVQALASERVEVAGWVPDLEPLLGSARVMVAPLTYGAGLKGKITQSLAAGLPVVTTSIGAEGLEAAHGEQVLISDQDGGLASQTLRALRDVQLWRHLSREGQRLIAAHCSLEVMQERMEELVSEPFDRRAHLPTVQLHLSANGGNAASH